MFSAVMYVIMGGHLMDHNTLLQFVIRLLSGLAFVVTNHLALVNGIKSNPILAGIVNSLVEIERDLVSSQYNYKFDYKHLYICIKVTVYFSVFYYCFLLGGMYVLNGIAKNSYYLASSMFVMCTSNVPTAGLFLNCFLNVWLVYHKLLFLECLAKRTANDEKSYEDAVKYIQFCTRLYCLIPIIAKCFGRLLILYCLLSLVSGSMHYYELFEYIRDNKGRTWADNIFVAASIMWLLSIQLQLVVLVITIGKTTNKVI